MRAIGWVNFLDDKTQQPHFEMAEVDQTFGVSTRIGQGRSKVIRDVLKPRPFDPEWTLPSRMGKNPVAWLVQVNGVIVYARDMQREVQEEAFRRGMNPVRPRLVGDRRSRRTRAGD